MDDSLEKFIKEHRTDLDSKSPGDNLWSKIEKELQNDSKIRSISRSAYLWRAAAVTLLLVTSWLVYDKVSSDIVLENGNEVALQNPELMEAETFYISLINNKREEIKTLGEIYDLGTDFLHEIDQLDSMYIALKKDMRNGNQENLVDAMILNLQLRIEILNQQLSIIQSIENSNKDETIVL